MEELFITIVYLWHIYYDIFIMAYLLWFIIIYDIIYYKVSIHLRSLFIQRITTKNSSTRHQWYRKWWKLIGQDYFGNNLTWQNGQISCISTKLNALILENKYSFIGKYFYGNTDKFCTVGSHIWVDAYYSFFYSLLTTLYYHIILLKAF